MSAENRRLTPEEEAAELAKPGSHPEWEIDLPADLQKAIEDYLEGIRAQVTYLDCLADELYGSINATNGDGTSPRSRRITCGRNTSSGRRTRKNRKNSSKPHNKDTGPLPGKTRRRFFCTQQQPRPGSPLLATVWPCVQDQACGLV